MTLPPNIHGTPRTDTATPTHMYWLVECYDLVAKRSRGLYWAGRSNRVTPRQDGAVDATYDVYAARRIPFDCEDLAQQIAEGLNKLSAPGSKYGWFATDHGFCG